MSRKNAFGPIGRLEPPQLARDIFLLTKIPRLCTHLSLGARGGNADSAAMAGHWCYHGT